MKKIILAFILISHTLWAAEPILKVGLMSDTHIKARKSSCVILKEALKLFRSHKVDMIVNAGDICEVHAKAAYINYRNTVKEVFSSTDNKPLEVFAFAWHDRVRRTSEPQEIVFNDVKKYLEFNHQMYDIFNLKGYTFLLFPQGMDFQKYEATIAKACQENPKKPVFVIDHIPPFNTVYNSLTWGEKRRRTILDKYPQVVHLSGHVHGTLTNELNIWQENFTAVNLGSLATWNGALIGNSPRSNSSDTVMIMEIYPEKLIFKRFFALSKKEYKSNERWIVPIPFNKSLAPYNFNYRKAKAVAPEFSSNAKLNAKIELDSIKLTFPHALHKDGVFSYKIVLFRKENNKWVKFSRKDIMGNFMVERKELEKVVNHNLSYGYFEKDKNYLIKVTPVGFFGQEGKALTTTFNMTSQQKSKVVFESKNPMNDCKFFSNLAGGKSLTQTKDGFYDHNVFNARLIFPKNIWTGKKGTQFRLTIDMHTKQSPTKSWTLVMRNPKPQCNANYRIQTPPGDSGNFRYIIDFKKQGDDFQYYLLIREGLSGKIRFNYVKIEQLD